MYYIPSLRNNIISLGQMYKEGNKVILKGEFLWIYDKQERLLMKVKRSSNRLYKLIIESNRQTCLLSKAEEVSKLWHARLGHVNYQALSMMSKARMARGMPKITQPKNVCDGCLLSKQTWKQFPKQTNYNSVKVLELVHGDLYGPISPETASGNRYFFLLVDDFSRFMWVYFLKNKDETLSAFKNFCALVEDGPEKRVKNFRSDRGGEFTSNEFKSYCEKARIQRHYTTPYTPQQNGVVERRNRTVVEMTRSCLKEMQLPANLWGEAVRHSVYILNRLPTRALTGQTPYEAWSTRKPDITHVRVFGCLVHMKIPANQVQKLDDRSKQVINLGKEPGTKGYRLYDPENNRVHISRDVTFEETKPWPWNRQDGVNDMQIIFPIPDVYMIGENRPDNENVNNDEDGNAENVTPTSQNATPTSQTPVSRLNPDNYDDSTEPRKIRPLSEVYNETEEVKLDEELYPMGIEEPANYKQAIKDSNWKQAMRIEISSIEENKTWELTTLPPGQKVIGLKSGYSN